MDASAAQHEGGERWQRLMAGFAQPGFSAFDDTATDLLRRAEESRLRTINVDDFDPIDLVANKTLFEPSAYHRAA